MKKERDDKVGSNVNFKIGVGVPVAHTDSV